ncbi:MAG: trigger factor [Eubacterium sp.]|nr:trigger factor [Eubacterium sp.]
MKKKICMFLVGAMCLAGLSGCGDKKDDKKSETSEKVTTEAGTNEGSSGVIADMKAKYADSVTLYDQYKSVKYTPSKTEVTDNDIEREKASLISKGTTTENVTTGIATYGDAVNIDYTGYVDGVAFDHGSTEGKGTEITLGSSGYIDNFDEQIVGHKPGDSFDVVVTFPDPYQNDETLSGKKAIFDTKLNSIVVKKVPEYNDELVKSQTSYATTAEFEQAMREKLKEENAENDKSRDKQNIATTVVNNSNISQYPEEEMQKLIDSMISQVSQLAESNGVDLTTLISYYYGLQTEDEFKDYISQYVQNYMRQKMIIVAVAKAENIDVTTEEYDAKKQELMANYNLTDETSFSQYYSTDDVYYMILAEKVVDFLYENAVVDDGSSRGDNSEVMNLITTEAATDTTTGTTEAATEATTEAATEAK